MGARINYVFKDVEDEAHVVLYSHWGETEWQRDLAMALEHSKPRWKDYAYFTRMMISYLIQDSVLEETGFGIYAIQGTNFELGETTVVIDITKETIYEAGKDLQVDWQLFINAYIPKVYAEISAMEGSPSA
jgi:uncharacterized protein (DUF1786 family)